MKKILFCFVFLVLVFLSSLYFILIQHESNSTTEESFDLSKPYLLIVKSLATKDSLERIVEQNDGKLTNKHWDSFVVEVPKKILRIKEYKLDGSLNFTVEKNDPSLGPLRLNFKQDIEVNKDHFQIKTFLVEPKNKVVLYNKYIEIKPLDASSSRVLIRSELRVIKFIPRFLTSLMNKKVDQSNKQDLINLKSNIVRMAEDSRPVVQFKLSGE